MNKKIRYLLFIIIFPLLIYGLFMTQGYEEPVRPPFTLTYLVPEHIEGCVWVQYEQPNAEPLEIINNEIIFNIPDSGILKTSSHIDFGPEIIDKYQLYAVSPSGELKKRQITIEAPSGLFISDDPDIKKRWLQIDGKGHLENCKKI